MKNIGRAIKLIPSSRRMVFLTLTVGIVSALVVAFIPLAIQSIINRLFEAITTKELTLNSILIPLFIWLGLRLVLMIVSWWQEIIEDNAFIYALTDFRLKIADRLSQLSLTYFEKNRVGKINSLIGRAPHEFASWLSSVTTDYLSFVLNALVALIILGIKFPPIALVVAVIASVFTWALFNTMQSNRKFWKINRDSVDDASGIQSENISFISHIRALGVERNRLSLYKNITDRHRVNMSAMYKFQHRRNFLNAFIDLLLYAVPLTIFAIRAFNGQQQPTDIYILSVYLGRISDLAYRLPRIWNNTAEVNDILGDTIEVLDLEPDVKDSQHPENIKSLGSLKFDNVSFVYEGNNREAVNGFSLLIPKGKTVALVGRSGSGKSTVIKLLLRFYDPQNGVITAGGVNLRNIAQNELRSRYGVVMQDVALFNDTIANNIAIARPDASQKEIEESAKVAHAHDFIMDLPDGYDTLVGERGIKLSGGEKQRVSIARAILRNPEVVLLDEATSALDSESEHFVQDGLKKLLKGRTAVIIAHRISTITHADKIVVMEKGRVIEEGTYEELKKRGGVFAELLARQQL